LLFCDPKPAVIVSQDSTEGTASPATGRLERPIFLVGMPGAGKSTVGRRLARLLECEFIDIDRELERRCGVPVETIFDLEGEPGFRRRESKLLAELAAMRDVVVATGGGAVLDPDNRRTMRESALVIYLDASIGELWHRLRNDKVRPLLQTADPRATLERLMAARVPLYEEVAHHRMRSTRHSAERMAAEIHAWLESGGNGTAP
jgi:shikimate kinase